MSQEVSTEITRAALMSVAKALEVSMEDDHTITITCLGKRKVRVTPEAITNIELHPRIGISFVFENRTYKLYLWDKKLLLFRLEFYEMEFGALWSQVN